MNAQAKMGVHFYIVDMLQCQHIQKLIFLLFHLVRMTGIEPVNPYFIKGHAATAYFLIYIIFY